MWCELSWAEQVKNQFPFKIYYIYDYESINNKLLPPKDMLNEIQQKGYKKMWENI